MPNLELQRPVEGPGIDPRLIGILIVVAVVPPVQLGGGVGCPVAALLFHLVLLGAMARHGWRRVQPVSIDARGASWGSERLERGPIELVGREGDVWLRVHGVRLAPVERDPVGVARELARLWETTWRDLRDQRTPAQRDFDERVEASRERTPEAYRVVAKQPLEEGTHEGVVYAAPDEDAPLVFEPRGIRQHGVLYRWTDIDGVGVVVDGAARLEVLLPDGIRALWLASPSARNMGLLLWMVGEIRRQVAERAARDEGTETDVPDALRTLRQAGPEDV